ncbi:MAG: plasmid stabilization system protein ParE [Rhodothermales bacterium]|jgi:plasmid stabilization system protein ParE
MKIRLLDRAEDDLIGGYDFYELQEPGQGIYFLTCLYRDIDSLRRVAGVHRQIHARLRRLLSKTHPYAVYYDLRDDSVDVHAVIACRQSPEKTRRRLGTTQG